MEKDRMKKTVFIYSGEGTQSSQSRSRLLKNSKLWPQIEDIFASKLSLNLEEVWNREIGRNRCPYSPLLTVAAQICLSDIWRQWGYRPDVVIGHSTGELAAAHQAGFYTLEDVLRLAYRIGEAASRLNGKMIHGSLSDAQIADLPVHLSSFNFEAENGRHVTLSGYGGEMEDFLRKHPDFVRMKLPHPWHHPDYRRFSDELPLVEAARIDEGRFVSGITAGFETRLQDDYWRRWLVSPVDFIGAMQAVEKRYGENHLDIVEIGFHPVLEKCCRVFGNYTYASSMFRGEDDIGWIMHQRNKLDHSVFLEKLKETIDAFKPQVDFSTPLAYQGFGSLEFAELSAILQPYFPSLAPQDFYRYKSIDRLIERFGREKTAASQNIIHRPSPRKNKVVISGMSCRFPSAVQTLTQFWDMLLSGEDQVRGEPGRGASEAGYLNDSVARFDHEYFHISPAEARTMDPQQILALELVEMLWRDAGIDPEALDRSRVGVYIGAWSQEYRGDRTSVYYPTGTNPSLIAARISHHYDLRGPSLVLNSACSSSQVALHYAVKDIEAGRVDYAVAGGVNMLLDERFTGSMRSSGFLSRDNRCKVFDDAADGYVRAEGGGMLLLVNKSLADRYYAEIAGSAVNQNGGRSQVITAPHPEAQEELITAACRDAGIRPEEIAYIECHGTGTKIGDPIEISAIQNTVARNRKDPCYIGSVKSNMGHLESAAGIAGLIKSVSILNHGIIPPNLHFHRPNPYIDFKSYRIRVVAEETGIDPLSLIGVGSFGFGGTNAYIIVKGAEAAVRKEIVPIAVPFDRERASSLSRYIRLEEHETGRAFAEPVRINTAAVSAISREDIDRLVGELFFQLTRIEEIDPEVELTDQGLDSMSGAEMISQLEKALKIEIDPDILFEHPLRDRFVDQLYALANGGRHRGGV
jgi:acyl transferase domain-containing protein/acyl carrier protein